jgi:hypothetical protein
MVDCLGLNYTPMVSVDRPSHDTIPLSAHLIVRVEAHSHSHSDGILDHCLKYIRQNKDG